MQNTGRHTVCLFTLPFQFEVFFFLIPAKVYRIRKLLRHQLAPNWSRLLKSHHFLSATFPKKTEKKVELFFHGQATSQSTMTCKNDFPNSPIWYIYNCTMLSSYIVRALILLIKLNFFFFLFKQTLDPDPSLKTHRPDHSRLWQSQCITGEWNSKLRGRGVYDQGLDETIYTTRNEQIYCWRFLWGAHSKTGAK